MKERVLGCAFAAVLMIVSASCGKDSDSPGIPLVEPPVTKATPSGLKGTAALMSYGRSAGLMSLDTNEIKNRFFSDGPTKVENLLKSIDTRIAEINTRSTETERECLSAPAVEQTIAVMGSSQKVYFQCYDVFGDGTGGMLFGKKDDAWYIYQNVGAGRSLAKVSPVAGTGEYAVEAWFSVGQNNATGCSTTWWGCSYGVIHLKANSSTKELEMTVAGTGFGYCGAHLKTEGTNLFITGSGGGGTSATSWSCSTSDSSCTLASNLTQAGTCTSIGASSFELTSLGVTGQSNFGTGVTLDGTSTDSVHFGPDVAGLSGIAGVAKF